MSRLTRTSGNSRVLLRTATATLSTLAFLVCGTPTAHADESLDGDLRLNLAGGKQSQAPHALLNRRQESGPTVSESAAPAQRGKARSAPSPMREALR